VAAKSSIRRYTLQCYRCSEYSLSKTFRSRTKPLLKTLYLGIRAVEGVCTGNAESILDFIHICTIQSIFTCPIRTQPVLSAVCGVQASIFGLTLSHYYQYKLPSIIVPPSLGNYSRRISLKRSSTSRQIWSVMRQLPRSNTGPQDRIFSRRLVNHV
jgi:hypothetical protein